jgi:ABC-type Na+ transport system ATPase subunit NatA
LTKRCAGKTTAIRVLATVIKPDGGGAEVLGHDVLRNATAVSRDIDGTTVVLTTQYLEKRQLLR